jgi:hypothetical protein
MNETLKEKPTAAFILSLLGGIFMILGGGLTLFVTSLIGYGMGYSPGWHMMGWGMMGFLPWFWIIGLVSGVIVLIGAAMLYTRPEESATWGVLILMFSIISLLGMGGFLIGFLLGLIGGILAIVWKPK